MMPATLASGLPALPGRRVNVFGEPDEEEFVRVAVPVVAHLSFADMLALLIESGGLVYAELDDDQAVRDALNFALLATDVVMFEDKAAAALTVLHGRGERDTVKWARALAATITRVFGVAA
ncbi:hypothetical protein AB0D33_09660 [Streptomyces sp. NPDC048404]|uniref:hypothetical protein n=1 Tax=unclassified Streptomyces TaxID=2593676 RepID=UPI0034245185